MLHELMRQKKIEQHPLFLFFTLFRLRLITETPFHLLYIYNLITSLFSIMPMLVCFLNNVFLKNLKIFFMFIFQNTNFFLLLKILIFFKDKYFAK